LKTRIVEEVENMTKVGEIYLCEVWGNKVKVLEAREGTLVCCGKPMKPAKSG
jgi:superoxide reductase